MRVISIQVPEAIGSLYSSERESLLRRAFRSFARQRIKELRAEMREAKSRIRQFETRYSTSFTEFEKHVLPNLSSAEAHEDYNEWFFWESVLSRQKDTLEKLQGSLTP